MDDCRIYISPINISLRKGHHPGKSVELIHYMLWNYIWWATETGENFLHDLYIVVCFSTSEYSSNWGRVSSSIIKRVWFLPIQKIIGIITNSKLTSSSHLNGKSIQMKPWGDGCLFSAQLFAISRIIHKNIIAVTWKKSCSISIILRNKLTKIGFVLREIRFMNV